MTWSNTYFYGVACGGLALGERDCCVVSVTVVLLDCSGDRDGWIPVRAELTKELIAGCFV